MFYSSQIELSESALKKNIRFLKKMIGPKVRFSSVIKGNAYGHGIHVFAPLAEKCGVDHFSVFSADEALKVSQVLTRSSEIMIMGYIDNEELEWAIVNQISFYVFEFDRLEAALRVAKEVKIPARIHLELETGLNRTGLKGSHLNKAAELIRDNADCFVVEGVCTHFAGAESIRNYVRIQNQMKTFDDLYKVLTEEYQLSIKRRHMACSAAAINYPEARMDMVRFGIAHYGFWPTEETKMQYYSEHDYLGKRRPNPLKRVIAWKSKVMSVGQVKAGEFIGYGTSYLTSSRLNVATVPIGYFHGFARNLSNLGRVLIHGRRLAVIGLVNMNMLIVDTTGVSNIKKGDEVVIIGKQKKLSVSVSSFSSLIHSVNYEVLVRLPSEIPRMVVN